MSEPTVASAMTTEVITIGPATPVKDIAKLLSENHISAVPVVTDDGMLLGVVSEADLIGKFEQFRSSPPGPLAGRRRRDRWQRSHGEIAYTVMTPAVLAIGPNDPVSAAVKMITEANVRRLFVIDDAGRLLGVLARHDLLRILLRDDEQILADIERAVLPRVRWADPALCRAAVVDGVVTLSGSVPTRAERELAGRLAAEIPGVVGVHNALDFTFDDAGFISD